MYKRNAQGWSKHFDFMVVDEISLQLAFVLAALIRNRVWAYSSPLYRTMAFTLVLVDAVVLVLNNSMHDVLKRGYYIETVETFKHCFYVFALANIYMFATQTGDAYSRIVLFLTFLFHFLIGYSTRLLWKIFVKKHGISKEKRRRMLVVATPDSVEEILHRLSNDEPAGYKITGVVLTEKSDRQTIGGVPVVAELEDAADYIVREWVDSVYIDAPFPTKESSS